MKNSYKYDGVDLTGHRNGRLTIVEKADKGRSWWVCKCDCGNVVTLQAWKAVKNKSCGCLERENRINLASFTRTHGMTETRLYSVWCGIKDRCFNPNTEHYDRYGGRGITMCDEWKNSFESFRDWAYSVGFRDDSSGREQSIDRIDVNGNYEPSNCKWASCKEQMRNTTRAVRVDYNGESVPLVSFCEEHGITYHHFVTRHLKRGFSAEEIIRIWDFKNGKHDGFYSMKEAAEHYGVGEQSIKDWIDKGKIVAEKVGESWFIPMGQEVTRMADRNNLGQFLPGISRPRGKVQMIT